MQKHVRFRNRSSERLAGVLHMPQDRANGFGVILCHGMESSKDSLKHLRLGESLSRVGFAVLRFDFTGAGESSGEFESITYARQVDDLGAAHDTLVGYKVFECDDGTVQGYIMENNVKQYGW